jgi:site-specific recombinase XerD
VELITGLIVVAIVYFITVVVLFALSSMGPVTAGMNGRVRKGSLTVRFAGIGIVAAFLLIAILGIVAVYFLAGDRRGEQNRLPMKYDPTKQYSIPRTTLIGSPQGRLPPILGGDEDSPAVRKRWLAFVSSLADFTQDWLAQYSSINTQRAYRQDLERFSSFLQERGYKKPYAMFYASIKDVGDYVRRMRRLSPETRNRRLSSISSFYDYLAGQAAEWRLPTLILNPARGQFVPRFTTSVGVRGASLSVDEALALMSMPVGDSIIAHRDRAVLSFYLYTGAELSTGCRLKTADFNDVDIEPTVQLNERCRTCRIVPIHAYAAHALRAYIQKADLRGGSLFRRRRHARGQELGERVLPAIRASAQRRMDTR